MKAGEIVTLGEDFARRYSWPRGTRFEVLRTGELGAKVALLDEQGQRVKRSNGVEEHVLFSLSALVGAVTP